MSFAIALLMADAEDPEPVHPAIASVLECFDVELDDDGD